MDAPLLTAIIAMACAFVVFRVLPRWLIGVPFVAPKVVAQTAQEDDAVVLLDVRTPEEFSSEHIDGSINVQPYELGEGMDAKQNYLNDPVFLICATSQRAAMSARVMKKLGFTNVSILQGGIKKWKKQGLPVKRG